MKISLISSSHSSFDDRIYYHMAISLLNHGHKTQIISSFQNNDEIVEKGIEVDSFDGNTISKSAKISIFIEKLLQFKPSIIICSEPLTVYAAYKYSKKEKATIVYDITEYYPSKKNLRAHNLFTKWLHFIKYYIFYLYALKLSDAFIFGEYYKSIIPKFFFYKKPFETISYYPKQKLFPTNNSRHIENELNLCYTGPISIEKGFMNFMNVIESLNKLKPRIKLNIKIIGDFVEKDQKICEHKMEILKENNKIEFYKFQRLNNYIELIKNVDIFMDLRSADFENKHCLPIKLFYYMALERPVIYSELKSIPKLLNINDFGHLVNPTQTLHIATIIINYIKNPVNYLAHCNKAKELFSTKYNWDIIEANFIDFLNILNSEN